MRKTIIYLTLILMTVIGTAGDYVAEERQVASFSGIELHGSGTVYLTKDNEEQVTVEARSDMLPYIETDVRWGRLHLGVERAKRRHFNTGDITYRITAISVEHIGVSGSGDIISTHIISDNLGLHISGSGDIEVEEIKSDEVDVHISGSGSCSAAGKTEIQEIHISGSGKYSASNLESKVADVHVSGSGDVSIWVEDKLNTRISGSGKVGYFGRPAIDSHSSGSGRTRHLGDR